MRGSISISPRALESIHRSPVIADDSNKRRLQRNTKEFSKLNSFTQGRNSRCEICSMKMTLFVIICEILLTLLYSLAVFNEHSLHSGLRSRWIWHKMISDSRYVSHLNVDWAVSKALDKQNGRKVFLKISLLNFNISEVNYWQQLLSRAETSVIHLQYVNSNPKWEDLYPEWIDGEEKSEVPAYPSLSEPRNPIGSHYDLITVKIPPNKIGEWACDVARLYLRLPAAKLATTSVEGHRQVISFYD